MRALWGATLLAALVIASGPTYAVSTRLPRTSAGQLAAMAAAANLTTAQLRSAHQNKTKELPPTNRGQNIRNR